MSVTYTATNDEEYVMTGVSFAEREKQVHAFVAEHIGVTITPTTPHHILDTSDDTFVLNRYIFPHVVVDIGVGKVDDVHSMIFWSDTDANPSDTYMENHFSEPTYGWLHVAMLPVHNPVTVKHYLGGKKDGVWFQVNRVSRRFPHQFQEKFREPVRFTMGTGSPLLQDSFYVHGTKVASTPSLNEAVNSNSPAALACLIRHENPHIAYFAAHNPACPETAKAEYALTRGEDFPK